MQAKIQEAIKKLSSDPQVQAQFRADPRQTLVGLGLDPDKIKFVKAGTTEELSEGDLANVSGGVNICVHSGVLFTFESKTG